MSGKRYIQVIVRMTGEEKCQAIWLAQRLGMTLSGALRLVVAEKYATLESKLVAEWECECLARCETLKESA